MFQAFGWGFTVDIGAAGLTTLLKTPGGKMPPAEA
jgi:hypothetical protein